MKSMVWIALSAIPFLLQGCAGLDPKENVIFTTKTSIGEMLFERHRPPANAKEETP